MMTGELKINNYDAWTNWRCFLEDGSLEKLMLPAPSKPYTENKSRSFAGKQVLIKNPKPDERDITLVFCFAAHEINSFPPFSGNNDPDSMQISFKNMFLYDMGMAVNITTVKSRVNAFITAYSNSLAPESRVIVPKLQSVSDAFLGRYVSGSFADPEEFYLALRAYLATILRTAIIPDAYSRMMAVMDMVRAGYVYGGSIYPLNMAIGKLNTIFKVVYISALELSSANNTIAKIALRFNEPDPSNRTLITG